MTVTRESMYDAAFWLGAIISNSAIYASTDTAWVKIFTAITMCFSLFMLGGLGRYFRNRSALRPRGNSNGRES